MLIISSKACWWSRVCNQPSPTERVLLNGRQPFSPPRPSCRHHRGVSATARPRGYAAESLEGETSTVGIARPFVDGFISERVQVGSGGYLARGQGLSPQPGGTDFGDAPKDYAEVDKEGDVDRGG